MTCSGQSVTVRGHVLDKNTREPIIFAKVKVTFVSNVIAGAMTDADGFFSISKPADTGNFEITIESIDYKPLILTGKIKSAAEIIDMEFILEPEENNEAPSRGMPEKAKTEIPPRILTREEIERLPSHENPSAESKSKKKRRKK